jgi:amino acid adenylation domain-containing protein/non-ribosomal peptide synthase protein (TIGR01720 family)
MTEPAFVELFERRVALAPDAAAVIYDGVVTTYAELSREADRLARHLRGLGVGRGSIVGVLVERSPRLPVAILGVLKAGGAFLPLDPGYPAERLSLTLVDAAAKVLVTQQRPAAALAAAGVTVPDELVMLDGPTAPAGSDAGRDWPAPDPESLAYVIYTSGSTGRPKGAMVEHRSLAVFARDVADRLGLGAGDRFLQFASPGFDVLVEELFPTWLAGGAVVIPARHLLSGEDDLVSLIERERLSVIELPTAYWHEWVRELDRVGRRLPESLRLVIIGGERVLPQRLILWRQFGVPLLHVYGLTETTCSSTFFRLDPADPVQEWLNLPIGSPLPSAELRVLDRRLRPVPQGGTGELYIGGVSLARGYLGQPGLTAQRFIANPEPDRAGQRLYRTGDLVRQRPDGDFEFISRVDTQIKIRGFRVEPMEIESTLSRHPQVAESVVTLYEPTGGDRRLVAYVVPRPGPRPGVADLRRFLERELPAHMVPSAFVELDALPLNANGKVDRERLPEPAGDRPEVGDGYVEPQTDAQRRLAEIIGSVVGLNRLGIHDNFFEVGGDSILAIQVVSQAQEAGLKLTPYDLFAQPTVASLAELLAAGNAVDAEQGEVTGPVSPAPMQRWFCSAGFEDPQHWNTSVLLELGAPAEPRLLREAVGLVLGHHDGLRQRFLLAGDRTRARIAPCDDETPFEVADLADLDPVEQDRRVTEVLARLQRGLDLAVGPLLRTALFQFGGSRPDRLAIVAHRLVADVRSLRIVLEDLETSMVQLAGGEELRFLPKTTSWQSWGRRLGTYARSEQVQAERPYWTELLSAGAGRLPYDMTVGPEGDTEANTGTVTTSLDATETYALLHSVPSALVCDVEELLLACLARALSTWSGCDRHLVDRERHDREHDFDDVDLSRTVGWFSRTHPIALTCEPESSPDETLRSVQESLRAVPGAGIGWQLLRQDADQVPHVPVEVAFSYLGPAIQPASGSFTVVAEPIGDDRSPAARRPYPIEVTASVARATLQVQWRYSERLHHRQTVQRLADRHRDELRAMIERGRRPVGWTPTPADFPLARVDQGQLSDLLSRLEVG